MSIHAISGNQICGRTAFKGDASNEDAKQAKVSGGSDRNKNNKKKLAITLGILAGAGIAAIAIAKKRKFPSEIDIEKFKKAGGFEKVENDGVTRTLAMYKKKPYTGTINVTNKAGDYHLEYKDGVLDNSLCVQTFTEGDEILASASRKVYSYGENGKLSGVETFRYYDTEKFTDKFSSAEIISSGKLGENIKSIGSDSLYIKDGEVTVKHVSPELDSITTKKTLFGEDGSLKSRIATEKKLDKKRVAQVIKNAGEKQAGLS